MSAWRPIQALEIRAFSARAATFSYSSRVRLMETRYFEGIAAGPRCADDTHGAAPWRTMAEESDDVNSIGDAVLENASSMRMVVDEPTVRWHGSPATSDRLTAAGSAVRARSLRGNIWDRVACEQA